METSRTKNSSYNIIMGFMNKAIATLLTFISRYVFLKFLSLEYLGINGLFSDVLSMLTLADLGFATAMAYSFYKPLAQKDERKLSALIQFYKKLYNYIALIVGGIGIAILPFLRMIVNTEKDIPYLEWYYLVALANTVISYLFIYKSTIITADQKSYLVTKYSMWVNFARTIIQIIVLCLTHNYFCYVLVSVFTTLINNLIVSKAADKYYPYINAKNELTKEEKKSIFVNMKSVFLYKVSSVLLTGTDNILISILVGTAAVGLYANYNTIVSNITAFSSIIVSSLTASIGNLVVKENETRRYEVFKVMQMVSFTIGGVVIGCLWFLMQDFIVLWIGEKCLLGQEAVFAILVNFYLALILPPIWVFREATGLYQKTKYIMLITAGINIALSIVLGLKFGVAGIIAATFISKISTYFWYEPKLLFHEFFHKKVHQYYLSNLINLFILIFGIFLLTKILPKGSASTWLEWIIRAFICGGVMSILYLIRFVKTSEFKSLKERILRILKGVKKKT